MMYYYGRMALPMFDRMIRAVLKIMPEPIQRFYDKHEAALLYIFFGGLTTVVSIGTQYLSIWLGAPTTLSTTVSWICAVTFAFFTNKHCVFKSETRGASAYLKEALAFYGARLVSYFLELGFMLATVDYFHLNAYIMKLIAQIFVLVINYLFSKLVIFKKKTGSD